MKRRFFVACGISDVLAEQIFLWEQKFIDLPVRWLGRDALHITVVPPWEADNERGAAEFLGRISGIGPFPVFFSRVSFGPSEHGPRLVWARGPSPKPLLALRDAAHRACSISDTARSFYMHVTIARFRPELFSQFRTKHLDERMKWHDEATSFRLMESHLVPGGASYETLAEFSLVS